MSFYLCVLFDRDSESAIRFTLFIVSLSRHSKAVSRDHARGSGKAVSKGSIVELADAPPPAPGRGVA